MNPSQGLYETEYKTPNHFSFGDNWFNFLTQLNPARIRVAEQSLKQFLGGEKGIKGKTFLDVGCGSGIFSLAAYRLKAAKVVSLDVDSQSIACTQLLREREDRPKHWDIKTQSVLQARGLKALGQFDIVYSWGVLHHTGNMPQAIRNITTLVKPDGKLYIAIYNEYNGLMHGSSRFWHRVKQHYNQSSQFIKSLYFLVYASYLCVGLVLTLKNPFRYIREYQTARGMSWKHDVLDWLGGYPYEYANPADIISSLSDLGFTLTKMEVVNTIGCNEYVFVKNKPMSQLPPVTVLLSVHNNAQTLSKALHSVAKQTLQPNLLCIDDASTDPSAAILLRWKKKLGKTMTIITNEKNIGLTRSLNLGLKSITTPYTARIDADDWWEPTKLEKQVNFLTANPAYGVVGSWYTNHGLNRVHHLRLPIRDDTIRQTMIHRNPFAHSCVVFRTKLIQQLRGYNPTVRYGQDYELWLRCLPKTKMFNLPQELCHRLITGGISIEKQREQMRYALKTRFKYIRQYKLPSSAYLSLVEPWLVSSTPRFVTNLKRRMVNR